MKKILYSFSLFMIGINAQAQFVRTVLPVNVQTQLDGNKYYGVLVSGSTSAKYDIVFIGDGFRIEDQPLFNAKVDEIVAILKATVPFANRMNALNIWRVNVVSHDAGVDYPSYPFGGIFKSTALDLHIGNPAVGEIARVIYCSSPEKCVEAAGYAPAYNAIIVLANAPGIGGGAFFPSTGLLIISIASIQLSLTHEMGHQIAGLADEYDCLVCDGNDRFLTYSGLEPYQKNLTADISSPRPFLKWGGYISPFTPIPTPSGSGVGLFEGGGYFSYGIYRSQNLCMMRNAFVLTYCAICRDEMDRILEFYAVGWRIRPGKLNLFKQCFWKVPECASCPVVTDIRATIVLPEINTEDYRAEVVDASLKVVSTSRVVNNQLQIDFAEKSREGYFVRILPVSGQYTGQAINFLPKMLRNNQEVHLF